MSDLIHYKEAHFVPTGPPDISCILILAQKYNVELDISSIMALSQKYHISLEGSGQPA
jgi:hypothetical protein